MDELETLIKSIITTRINQDENVKNDSFVLSPYQVESGLNGDGKPEEVIVTYQLDFFYSNRGKTLYKSKELFSVLSDYIIESCMINWEQNARLWRCTAIINSLE